MLRVTLEIDCTVGLALVDETGFLLTRPQRVVEGLTDFVLTEPLVITPSQARVLTITANFASGQTISQTTFSLSVSDASQVTANTAVRGQFPLVSATHTLIPASNIISHFVVDIPQKLITPVEIGRIRCGLESLCNR